jgi:hypothetical protein
MRKALLPTRFFSGETDESIPIYHVLNDSGGFAVAGSDEKPGRMTGESEGDNREYHIPRQGNEELQGKSRLWPDPGSSS